MSFRSTPLFHRPRQRYGSRRPTRQLPLVRLTVMLLVVVLTATACGGSSEPVLVGDATARGAQTDATPSAGEGEAEPSSSAAPTPSMPGPADGDDTDDNADEGTDQGTNPTLTTTDGADNDGDGDGSSGEAGSGSADSGAEPTSTAGPSEVVASGGAVATYRNTDIGVLASRLVTTEPGDLLAAEATGADTSGAANGSWLLTELALDSAATSAWRFDPASLSLVDPSGLGYPAEGIYDTVGDEDFAPTIEGRDLRYVHAAFEVPPGVAVDGDWLVRLDDGNAVPLVLPLSGPAFAPKYPLALVDGAAATLNTGSFSGCSDGVEATTVVRSATVALEGAVGSSRLGRVAEGERLVTIELDVSGVQHDPGVSTLNCGEVILWPDFILRADERPVQATTNVLIGDIEDGASVTIDLRFTIDAATDRIELVGGEDLASLAVWDLDLMPTPGEVGAELVPYRAKGVAPTPSTPDGERPSELTTIELATGGASAQMLRADVTVAASAATTATIDSYLDGSPEHDPSGRTFVVVDFDVENLVDQRLTLPNSVFVLVDPEGNPHGRAELHDRNGDNVFQVALDGLEFIELRGAFETDGLVEDLSDWSLQIHAGDTIPLVVPLDGPSVPSGFPLGLQPSDTVPIDTDRFPGCAQGLADATVTKIDVDIEGYGRGRSSWVRTSPDERLIVLDLLVDNKVSDEPFSLDVQNCGVLSFFPEFLLLVDGRPTQSYSRLLPNLDGLESATIDFVYPIPADTREIVLIGGRDGTVIGRWLLKDAGQVLDDFGATTNEDRTVITLSEQVLFAFGESTLQQSAYAPLDRVAAVVNENAEGQIEIVGHTDSIGSDEFNQALSEARAQAVADALVDAGVDADRLVVVGRGESEPVAPNTTDDGQDNPAGRELNRRVEISYTTG